jgi:N utilization substance protein B
MCYLFDVRRIEEPDKAMEVFEVLLLEQKLESDEYTLSYARELIGGIVNNRFEIDGLIRMNMTGWRPERMGIIDRAAVFLALYEGVVGRKVDVPVAISEAVNLARSFGSDESARFVNGVLGKIVRAIGIVSVNSDELFENEDSNLEV